MKKQQEKKRAKEDMLFAIFCSLGVLAVFLVLILSSLMELNKI